MKNKLSKIIILALTLILVFGSVSTFAYESYDTYTYSIDGMPLLSPMAYSADDSFNSYDIGLVDMTGKALTQASDLAADEDGNLYITDTKNNRIVVLNKYYEATHIIDSYVDEYGNAQTFSAPKAVFVSKRDVTTDVESDPYQESRIYVCDTNNERIVVFTRDYQYERTVEQPSTPLIKDGDFRPVSVAVDKYGRIFVISENLYQGVVVLSSKGDFTGFIGAQKVSFSLLDQIWRNFQTEEQKAASLKNVSVSYNNITVDEDGFVYVTTDKIAKSEQYAAIRSKSATYSPVKKLNSTGVEIMKRNGFFDPGGEVVDSFNQNRVSTITDITLGPEGSWTILDSSRSRLFTYDEEGNLLFAFGDNGTQLGNAESIVAATYQLVDGVWRICILDNNQMDGYKITVFTPTEYCDTIIAALRNQNEHNYDASIDYWRDLLTSNNNFDLAYIGIGKALYSQGEYAEAYAMLQKAYETNYASDAFAEMRKDIIEDSILIIVAGVIALIVLFVKFLGYAKKLNKITTLKVGRKSYWEELVYAFHLVFHPFDGFWDLKHEQRGSVRAGTTYLAITIVCFFYNTVAQGYLFNTRGSFTNIFVTLISVLVPVMLWIVANWCLTTLFDGEGSFKDIYIATTYSLAPLPIFIVLSTVLSNIMTTTEGTMVTMLITIGLIWVGILLFFGTLVTHDYSLGKNFVTILGTIVAMVVIMFIAILFSSLVIKMVQFVISIFAEIGNRV
ncbi:MAG: YIP1 family protein [Clostridia bacterium]|nr:YIP1 family protein [Clostridia bacterium]